MRQPDIYIDNKTIALLTDHPGWKHLKNLFNNRLDAEMEAIVHSPLYDTESIAKHNVRIGRIQAWEEVLSYPDQAVKIQTSTG